MAIPIIPLIGRDPRMTVGVADVGLSDGCVGVDAAEVVRKLANGLVASGVWFGDGVSVGCGLEEMPDKRTWSTDVDVGVMKGIE